MHKRWKLLVFVVVLAGLSGCASQSKEQLKLAMVDIVCKTRLPERAGNFMEKANAMNRTLASDILNVDAVAIQRKQRRWNALYYPVYKAFEMELKKRDLNIASLKVLPKDTVRRAEFAISVVEQARKECPSRIKDIERKIQEVTMLLTLPDMGKIE